MTMLASWVGIDTHGIGSAYIVSDSRFTWNNNTFFDYGKKVFASNTYPEIFGYAGDVLFPSIVLSQIVEMIDSGLLFTPNTSCEEKNKLITIYYKKNLHSIQETKCVIRLRYYIFQEIPLYLDILIFIAITFLGASQEGGEKRTG